MRVRVCQGHIKIALAHPLALQLRNQKRRAEGLAHINAIKRKIGLCECGCGRRVEPGMEFLFDWDHLDPAKKTARIGQMAMSSKEKLDKEISNCRLLYCLCHAAHTRNQNAERVAERMKAIAEMEQAKVVASTMSSLLTTLTGPLAAAPAAPAASAAPAAPVAVKAATTPKEGQGQAWLVKKKARV